MIDLRFSLFRFGQTQTIVLAHGILVNNKDPCARSSGKKCGEILAKKMGRQSRTMGKIENFPSVSLLCYCGVSIANDAATRIISNIYRYKKMLRFFSFQTV